MMTRQISLTSTSPPRTSVAFSHSVTSMFAAFGSEPLIETVPVGVTPRIDAPTVNVPESGVTVTVEPLADAEKPARPVAPVAPIKEARRPATPFRLLSVERTVLLTEVPLIVRVQVSSATVPFAFNVMSTLPSKPIGSSPFRPSLSTSKVAVVERSTRVTESTSCW